jgi:hypothetical protein
MEFEVHMTVTRTDSVKTYVHADRQEDAERKVHAAMDVATEIETANDVRQLIIDGNETPVEYDDYVSDSFEVADVTAVAARTVERQIQGGELMSSEEKATQLYDIDIFIQEPYKLVTVVEAESVADAEEKVREAMDDAQGDRRCHEVTRLLIDGVMIPVEEPYYWPDDEFRVRATPHKAVAEEVPLVEYTVYYRLADGTYCHEVVMAASKEAAAQQTVDGLKWCDGWEILGVSCA